MNSGKYVSFFSTALFLCWLLPSPSAAGDTDSLSINTAIHEALKKNLSIELTRQEAEAAQGAVQAEQGLFDPLVTATGIGEKKQQTALFAGGAEEEKTALWTATLSKKMETGTTVDLTWENQRYRTDSLLAAMNPSYNSALSVGVSQPLLKGNGREIQTAAIVAAEKNADAALSLIDSQAADLAARVKIAYWELVFARQDIEVKKLSLALAEKLLDETRRKIEIGTMAGVDIYQPESEVARREEVLIASERAIAAAEDLLKTLLNRDDLTGAIVPGDLPAVVDTLPDEQEVIEKTLAARPDITAADLAVAAADARLQKARDNVRPSLSLEGRAGVTGTDDRYGDSLDRVMNDSDVGWRVGLVFSVPLGNRTARGQQAIALAEKNRARTSADLLRQELTRQAREAVRNVTLSLKSIEASRKTALAVKKRMEAEEDKFEVGLATALDVLEAQEAYARALIGEKRAKIDHVEALAELDRLQGILEVNGEQIARHGPPPHHHPNLSVQTHNAWLPMPGS